MEKDYNRWNHLKQRLDKDSEPPFFNEREVWWLSVGVNVGYEIYGKGTTFTRPVVIVKKTGRYTFLGVPMTSKRKDRPFCVPVSFAGEHGSALVGQMRMLDSRRLVDRIGTLGKKQFGTITAEIRDMV